MLNYHRKWLETSNRPLLLEQLACTNRGAKKYIKGCLCYAFDNGKSR